MASYKLTTAERNAIKVVTIAEPVESGKTMEDYLPIAGRAYAKMYLEQLLGKRGKLKPGDVIETLFWEAIGFTRNYKATDHIPGRDSKWDVHVNMEIPTRFWFSNQLYDEFTKSMDQLLKVQHRWYDHFVSGTIWEMGEDSNK